MDKILFPVEENYTKDEFGTIYHTEKVKMPLKKVQIGRKMFKERLTKIRKRNERKKKELEQIEELSEEQAETVSVAEKS